MDLIRNITFQKIIWDKVFISELSKFCGRQPLRNSLSSLLNILLIFSAVNDTFRFLSEAYWQLVVNKPMKERFRLFSDPLFSLMKTNLLFRSGSSPMITQGTTSAVLKAMKSSRDSLDPLVLLLKCSKQVILSLSWELQLLQMSSLTKSRLPLIITTQVLKTTL